ncbi:MAG: class I SAM-dependent methyltransferase [Myxococcota bacterium]|nr:class I SAM-dependent methyltransferase [Myxococcota bacterium]
MSDPDPGAGEAFVRAFHAARPGAMSAALARGESYRRLAERAAVGSRVLDVGCGDGHLLEVLAARGCRPVGIDVAGEELARSRRPRARARAQALPFASASFDAAVSHLAFMLMDEPEVIVDELARVLVAGGGFHAVLGGGPTATGDDAFHRFLELGASRFAAIPRLGDPRTKSEAGWGALFAGWDVTFERCAIDLGGSFEEVWAFLGSSYELAGVDVEPIRAALADRVAGLTDEAGRVPCTVVTWFASAIRR